MWTRATRIGVSGFSVIGLLLLSPTWGQASHEPFGVYEDWTGGSIRADRWLGFEEFRWPGGESGDFEQVLAHALPSAGRHELGCRLDQSGVFIQSVRTLRTQLPSTS